MSLTPARRGTASADCLGVRLATIQGAKVGKGHAPVVLDEGGEVGAHEPVQEDAAGHRVEQEQDVQRGRPTQRSRDAAHPTKHKR